MLLKELGASVARAGTTAAGAVVVAQALLDAGIPIAGVRIADGSGLSLLDRLTAEALVEILRAGAGDPEIRDAFVTSLAVAGVSGTLEERLDRAADARPGDREDRDDQRLLRARRLRPAPLRLRDHPERLAGAVLVGAARRRTASSPC